MAEVVRRSRWPVAIASLLGLAVLIAARAGDATIPPCEGCGPSARPHVLLVTIDALRADHLGVYGYTRPTSPNLDALAREGALFEAAYSPTGATGPAHATLFTGRPPLAHGVERNGLVLPPSEETLAERLAAAGYQTAAFVSSFPLTRRYGLDQGFRHYDDAFPAGAGTLDLDEWSGATVDGAFDRRARATVRSTLDWLAGRSAAEPQFVWVHLFDPHDPYDPPPRFAQAFPPTGSDEQSLARARYDAEIAYTDAMLGRLVKGFDAWAGNARTVVIVTADHGEGLWDHGWRSHNRFLYDEETRVPLVWRERGRVAAGLLVPEPVQLADVAPTLLADLGVRPRPKASAGRDLVALLRGETRGGEEPVFFQAPRYPESPPLWGPSFAVRVGRWKLIEWRSGETELYDLWMDAGEHENLARREPRVRAELAARLSDWRDAQALVRAPAPPAAPLDAQERLALGALGYLEPAAAPTRSGTLSSPK